MSEKIEFGMQIIKYGDPSGSLEDAILCEKAGFDHISVPDHLFHPFDERFINKPAWDAYVLLSAAAVKTQRIKLSTGVSDPIRRHPATIAHIIATLDLISNGRARLGMGAGERFTFNPLRDIEFNKPVTLLREALIVIRGLWSATRDNPLNFEGEFLKVKNGYLGLYPIQKYPPILIGGYGPKMKRIVAELGDYWLPYLESVETYRKNFGEIKRLAKKFGREEAVKGALMTFTSIAASKEEALESVSRRVRVGIALRRRLLEDLGYKHLAEKVKDLWDHSFSGETLEKTYEVADSLPEKVVEDISIIGNREDVIDKIEKFNEAGVNLFIVIPPPDKIRETIERYGEIIQYFREMEKD